MGGGGTGLGIKKKIDRVRNIGQKNFIFVRYKAVRQLWEVD